MRAFLALTICFLLYRQGLSQTAMVTKHALIFAIGDYPEGGGWRKISSLHDVQYIRTVLLHQSFPEQGIKIVSDKDATIEGINRAFKELIDSVHPGDIVVIHFSSHGERVEADNDNKLDGLDECVVTYNAVSPFQSKDFQKDQAQYLRGHVIGDYLRKLRTKLGRAGDVAVFMDDCYSGDGTRGAAVIRGGEYPFVSPTFDPHRHRKSDSSLLYKQETIAKEDETGMASYEVISATRPEESDYETFDDANNTSVGSLTYAISKAFESMRSSAQLPTYRALFANIQAIMNVKVPNQHPLLEGNGEDRVIFGGQFKYQMPYIELAKFDNQNNQVTVKQGKMGGLDTGATISLYPAGTLDTAHATLLAKGRVIHAESFLATAILDRKLAIITAAEAWAFVTARAYPIEPVGIRFVSGNSMHSAVGFSVKEVARLKKYCSGLAFISLDARPELMIVKGKNADSLKISTNGYLFSTIKDVLQDTVVLQDKLASFARYKFLQTLHSEVKNVQVDVELVPLIYNKPDTGKIKSMMVNNSFVAHEGDTLTLKIKNTGTRDVYVNILDMQPDGVINPVLPNSHLAYPIYSHDLKILAGEEFFLPANDFIVVSPPFGTEVFKIFASEKEINLENVATSRGLTGGGAVTAIEKLVRNAYSLSRGAQTISNTNADATISELIFQIKPRLVRKSTSNR